MSKKIKCSECGTTVGNIEHAKNYPALASWLEAWHALETSGDALLCPGCAQKVLGDLSGQTARIIPIDLRPQD